MARPRTNDTASREPGWRPAKGWAAALAGRSPDAVLATLVEEDDPLRLRRLVAREIRAAALFVDADQVHLRSIARISHGVGVEGAVDRTDWVVEHVRTAIDDVLAAERRTVVERRRSDRLGVAPVADGASPFDVLARPFSFDAASLRAACDAFNRRPDVERAAFFALVVDRDDLDEAARRLGTSPTEAARGARRAFVAVLDAATPAVTESAVQEGGSS